MLGSALRAYVSKMRKILALILWSVTYCKKCNTFYHYDKSGHLGYSDGEGAVGRFDAPDGTLLVLSWEPVAYNGVG
jgi:hypothetical protein